MEIPFPFRFCDLHCRAGCCAILTVRKTASFYPAALNFRCVRSVNCITIGLEGKLIIEYPGISLKNSGLVDTITVTAADTENVQPVLAEGAGSSKGSVSCGEVFKYKELDRIAEKHVRRRNEIRNRNENQHDPGSR